MKKKLNLNLLDLVIFCRFLNYGELLGEQNSFAEISLIKNLRALVIGLANSRWTKFN